MQYMSCSIPKCVPFENTDLHDTERPYLTVRIDPFRPGTGIGAEQSESHGIDMEFPTGIVLYKLEADPDIDDTGNIGEAVSQESDIMDQWPCGNGQCGS